MYGSVITLRAGRISQPTPETRYTEYTVRMTYLSLLITFRSILFPLLLLALSLLQQRLRNQDILLRRHAPSSPGTLS